MQHLRVKQQGLVEHSFFRAVDGGSNIELLRSFVPGLAFWVMAFQDLLRLNEERVVDPVLRRIAKHHRAEDRGHETWYLHDLKQLGIGTTEVDVNGLFGRHHATTRDCAYALMSEVFRAETDVERIALLLTVESAGHVFFGKMAALVERAGLTQALRYFSFSHLEVEKQHEMFEREMERQLEAIELDEATRAAVNELIARCYESFSAMFDGLFETFPTVTGAMASSA
jgi:hypothetical protein